MKSLKHPTPWCGVALCLLLAGCDAGSTVRMEQIVVVTDPQTGCQYIREQGNITAITPRLGRDGKQICK